MTTTQARADGQGEALLTGTVALAMLLAALGTSIANIALPALAAAFAAPFAQVQAVVVAYLGTLTLSVLAAGRLGDRYGLKRGLVAGLALFALASLLCALAPGLWLLVAARALQGIGAALMMTLALALMRHSADPARIGRAMGLIGTVSALGTALGPALGGLLLPLTGWRGLFWVQVPLAVLALGLAARVVPEEAARPPSTVSAGGRMTGLLPNLTLNLLVAAVMMTTLVVGPFYLALGLGLGQRAVGLVMAVGPVLSIFAGVPSGRLVDEWGSRPVLMLGLALLLAGAALLALGAGRFGLAGYVVGIAVLTPGYQLFQAANTTATLADVPAERRGTVSGTLNLSRNLGLIAGASLMGGVFALGAGTADPGAADAAALAAGLRLTFGVAGGLMLAALLLAAGPWRTREAPATVQDQNGLLGK